MENSAKKAEVLNHLIEINNDRIKGYETAIEDLGGKYTALAGVFNDMIQESRRYRAELINAMGQIDAVAEESTTPGGETYRGLMEVITLFSGNDPKLILSSCEGEEGAAQHAYISAIEAGVLPYDMITLIQKQQMALKRSHDKIKALRDSER
jgi:uncharacterized protein (TIGR02284 family)